MFEESKTCRVNVWDPKLFFLSKNNLYRMCKFWNYGASKNPFSHVFLIQTIPTV